MSEDKNSTGLNSYFMQQQQQFVDKIKANMAQTIKSHESILKSMRPTMAIISERDHWVKSLLIDKYAQFEETYLSTLKKHAIDFQETAINILRSTFEQSGEKLDEIYSRTAETLLILGKLGWYLDPEMSMAGLLGLKKALLHDNINEIEKDLIEYFENRLDNIEKSIVAQFPHRAHLIGAAFDAHRRQAYELSMPVLLAQTDGICKEMVDKYLFIRKNKKPEIAGYVDQITEDAFRMAQLSPLTQILPINAPQCKRSTDFNALNRHAVLHGESLDYGSKINSLKAISLISYITYVLDEKDNHMQNELKKEHKTAEL